MKYPKSLGLPNLVELIWIYIFIFWKFHRERLFNLEVS